MSRAEFFRSELSAAATCRQRWQIVKKLLHNQHVQSVFDNVPSCHEFCDYFVEKIDRLKRAVALTLTSLNIVRFDEIHFTGTEFDKVPTLQPEDVLRVIMRIKAKSSDLDYVPTSLLKRCPLVFSELICTLATLSFSDGVFPDLFKSATVTPLLKKHGLDQSHLNNYRPISNLNNISKILERLFLHFFQPHLTSCPAFNPLQSAYRPYHSTETALLYTLDRIYGSADRGSPSLLVALDLSAAFDTIDHNTLILRLQSCFGVSGPALSWIQSYLRNRSQTVRLGQSLSHSVTLTSGVPQGSVLGPILFAAYISPVGQIVAHHGLCHQQYADDTQLYIALSKTNGPASVLQIEACLSHLQYWLCLNGLCLNPDKTEAIILGNAQQLRTFRVPANIDVAGCPVAISTKITTLGVTLDTNLTFHAHISTLCKSSYFHSKALRHIRSSLPDDVCVALATAMVQSRLDYANSLLYNIPAGNLNKLQRIQNGLAKIIFFRTPGVHGAELVRSLHWLPIADRIKFKLATLTFKVLNTHQPAYLNDLISQRQSSRTLRSSSDYLSLNEPRTRTAFGDRAFSAAVPKIWNAIPLSIRDSPSVDVFKRRLKTHYFDSR